MKKALCLILALVVLTGFLPFAQIHTLVLAAEADAKTLLRDPYARFLEAHKDTPRPVETLSLSPEAAALSDGAALRTDAPEKTTAVNLPENSTAQWTVSVPQTGLYNLSLCYLPGSGSSDIKLALSIDGAHPFGGDSTFVFKRAYKNAAEIQTDGRGNHIRPEQVQEAVWLTSDFKEDESLWFYLEEGQRTIALKSDGPQALLIAGLLIYNTEPLKSYESVKSAYTLPEATEYLKIYQAETPYLKSDAMLYPVADRTGADTQPADPVKIRLNTIGGNNYKYQGQWITYQIDIPRDGLYQIGVSYKQDAVRGLFSSRRIYIDGKIPFEELRHERFFYTAKWKKQEMGGQTPYLFELTQGTHEITLEVTQGEMAPLLQNATEVLTSLNDMYRSIIMVTGTTPDLLNDYNLTKEIAGLSEGLSQAQTVLSQISKDIETLTGTTGSDAVLLSQIAVEMESFLDKPETIPARLTQFRDNLSALGSWILRVREQPLLLDYIYVKSPDAKLPKTGEGFFDKLSFEVQAFMGSFFEDYNSIGDNAAGQEIIRVWLGTGREQAQSLKDLIDKDFTPQTGVGVEVNLVQGSLVQATLAKTPPDVILNVGRGDPVNLAIRNALEPLDRYENFNEIKNRFSPQEMVPYELEGRHYALPETKNFFMLFYRKDIFAALGLTPPETWEEFYRLIPAIQRSNMQIGMPYTNTDAYNLVSTGIGAQNIFTALLYQGGGRYYNDKRSATGLDAASAIGAFRSWTEFYTKYSFPLYYDFYNRFRTGEMPVAIQPYTMYSMLQAAAPEINNLWDMTPIPGIRKEDGTLDFSAGSTGTACVMLSKSAKKDAAFKFMDWWTSAKAQSEYGQALEVVMGPAARYNPANIEAFEALPWTHAEKSVLKKQWEQLIEAPEVPGGYYLARNLDNAFKSVYLEGQNPREMLYKWNEETNTEIARKRMEFGLDK